ncbi:transporter substrate-binding domain-containing protein [Pseudoalteromonas sp. SMS1]|uniref:substrate-binding periplasmic protein n=1 Tax=Pseudoalteromonas sp. SMS1 TaxID=2908894 RepID=UPI001F19CDBC|nr:transporter substrate-binding domain-containing protein [Pseudoalteromonas sp. SMS1]MCF2857744.1 transporter substrate-binding domain-containing protein [Pseudoalteromonas sp. SMS1]
MKYLFAALVLVFSKQLVAEQYHFVSINFLIEQEIGRIVLPEIYKRLDIDIKITPLPGKRAQFEASTGLKHGEIMRIFSYGEETPSTIRVPTPYYYLETMAFVRKDSGVKIDSVDALRNYHIVKVRGVKHTNNITKGMKYVEDMDTTKQILRLVSAGLADVALTNRIDGLVQLDELGITNVEPLNKNLAVLELFHYIHESQKHLVPLVNNKIIEMQRSGELAALISKAEQQVIKNTQYFP